MFKIRLSFSSLNEKSYHVTEEFSYFHPMNSLQDGPFFYPIVLDFVRTYNSIYYIVDSEAH